MATAGAFKNIRVYWLAFVVYWGIVLFGYDTGVAGGVVNNSYFQQHFGLFGDDGKPIKKKVDEVSANVVSVLQAGAFFGALASAPLSSWYGKKWPLLGFTAIFSVGAVLTTVANNPSNGLGLIYGGRVVSGFGIGGISAMAPAYVSECAPKSVRGRITGLFQIMVAIGVMISYFINFGIGIHIAASPLIWRVPFGFQLVPAGLMLLGLLTVPESPRFLTSVGRHQQAIKNLAYLRRANVNDLEIVEEFAEIEAAIDEENRAKAGLGWREAFTGKGNGIRFVIAFVVMLLQQWSGQNSVGYYAPQIFTSIGYVGRFNSLLASGIYGIVKVVATAIFIFYGVETLGRKKSFLISAIGMGTLFYIVGALLKTHPPPPAPTSTDIGAHPNPPAASKAMAAMLYIYVCFYSMGWGPLPWVYVSDIFPTRTRGYGLATASATQWLFNFIVSKFTPQMIAALGYKIFLMFATINILGMGTFSLLIPETKGRSLEDMDIIFGAVSAEQRQQDINRAVKDLENDTGESVSERTSNENETDNKA